MRDKKICLHLGFHKTASTYLQQTLGNPENAQLLKGERIAFYGPETLRVGNFLDRFDMLSSGNASLINRGIFKEMAGQLNGLIDGKEADRFIFSDENFVGTCTEVLWHGEIYPKLEERMKILARLFGESPVEVFVCLREMSSYLVSSYGEALRGTRTIFPFQRYVQKLNPKDCSWIRYLDTIRAVFPDSVINIWNFEDLKKEGFHDQIFACLLNSEISSSLVQVGGQVRRSLPKAGINLLLRSKDLLSEKEASSLIGLLDDPKMKWENREKINPWSLFEKEYWADVQEKTRSFLSENSGEFNVIG